MLSWKRSHIFVRAARGGSSAALRRESAAMGSRGWRSRGGRVVVASRDARGLAMLVALVLARAAGVLRAAAALDIVASSAPVACADFDLVIDEDASFWCALQDAL